ncbi:CCA tRNA nucleotidyltransferase [Buchananella hordeovulneris]|uniref:CCA tRNA nucleotidyltransferase n=1 Tax=Buchananella hordeovulneris TaxID=52770 RepID=A0A1Q5PTE1_9ACTO|nr:CCA tRNA nucleotidyltransferase [Buchananella hordeovulneris]OKL50725.1 CCA tRNA nucleotidyltransferase [Buchananella hordeovulneris]
MNTEQRPVSAPLPTDLPILADREELTARAARVFAALPAPLLELAHMFTAAGHEIALVGGPVRDAHLGVAPHDLDLTTSARPEESEEILRRWGTATWDMGRAFGTIGARRGQTIVEVTTYRTEEYEPASRKPVVAYGESLTGDLTRRDFTVNAMALRLPSRELVDPHHGLDDLAAGLLRTPVGAHQSFDDDPLRIMRAARFAAQLGLDVDVDVMDAMSAMADRLRIVSAERVRAELERLIISPAPRRGLELLVHTGVADVVLPELSGLQETVDEHGRHKDVYEHTLTVLDQAIALETGPDGDVPGPDFVLRFAALMHDVGKPATRRFEGRQVTFHHHEIVGAKMTAARMKALRFDKKTTRDVVKLVSLHLRFHGYGEAAWTDSAVRRYVTDAGDMLTRLHRLTRADCTTRNRRKSMMLNAAYDDLEARIAALAAAEEMAAIRPDLDGSEIGTLLGIEPGILVGHARHYLMELRMEHGALGREAAEEALRKWWAAEGPALQAMSHVEARNALAAKRREGKVPRTT